MKKITNLLLVVIFLAGLSLILYPTVSDWWNSMHQTRLVGAYVEKVADLSREEEERMYEEAVAYNEKLSKEEMNFNLSDEEQEEYMNTLDVTGTGIMGYVEIDKIHVKLPIYHGVEDTILQVAIGHIGGTSLPVGGKGTHCVISGHSGLPSARIFTDINKLEEGDHFLLSVLNRTLTYEVDQIRIVLPDELKDLQIDEDEDYCTLVTCTPYGVNTHRLLVRGHRVENAKEAVVVPADALPVDTKFVAFTVAMILSLLILLIFGGRRIR